MEKNPIALERPVLKRKSMQHHYKTAGEYIFTPRVTLITQWWPILIPVFPESEERSLEQLLIHLLTNLAKVFMRKSHDYVISFIILCSKWWLNGPLFYCLRTEEFSRSIRYNRVGFYFRLTSFGVNKKGKVKRVLYGIPYIGLICAEATIIVVMVC